MMAVRGLVELDAMMLPMQQRGDEMIVSLTSLFERPFNFAMAVTVSPIQCRQRSAGPGIGLTVENKAGLNSGVLLDDVTK